LIEEESQCVGGTLSLVQGGGLADIGFGEIDLTDSTLSLSGPFLHDGGILTTAASTLRLNANTMFRLGSDVTFETYEPNGWGLFLQNNWNNNTDTFVLTLGAVGTETIIQPSQESLTSGYVAWYHDDSNTPEYIEFNSQSGPTTIHPGGSGIDTNEVSLTINGDFTLKDNAVVYGHAGEVTLGELDLESGMVSIGGESTLNLAGGNVGEEGVLRSPGGPASVNLQGDLTVKGVFAVVSSINLDLAGNTIDASGGMIALGGSRSLDNFLTDEDTTP
jgi:hypothetical protein